MCHRIVNVASIATYGEFVLGLEVREIQGGGVRWFDSPTSALLSLSSCFPLHFTVKSSHICTSYLPVFYRPSRFLYELLTRVHAG